MKKFVITLSCVLIILTLSLALSCSNNETTSSPITGTAKSSSTAPVAIKTLKIGGLVPLSGPPSVAGIAFRNGWDLAVDKINSSGGIKIGDNTYKIDLIVEDDKGTADGSATAATKLVLQDGCKIIMGGLTDFEVAPMYDVTSKNGVLLCENMLATGKGIPGSIFDVGTDKPLLIRMSPATSEVSIIPIQYLLKNYPQVKNIGLIALAFPYYDSYATSYAAAWAPLGLTVSPDYERISPEAVDMVPTITRLLTTKPDAIYDLESTPSQFPLIIQVARNLGFNGPIMLDLPTDPADAKGAAVNLSDVITCGVVLDDPNLPGEVKQIITAGRAKYGKDFIGDCIFSYDELMLLTQIMQKAGSIDPAVIEKTFEGLTNKGDLQSVFGLAYVGGLKTTGVNRVLAKPSPLGRLVNGKAEYIGMLPVDIP